MSVRVRTGFHSKMTGPVTVGILGGGQLGRMMALEGRRLGCRVLVLDPDPRSPAGQVADGQVVAPFTDPAAVRQLAEASDVVTYEFENIPLASAAAAEGIRPLHPASSVLAVTQNRLREKAAAASAGIPVPLFAEVRSREDLESALRSMGTPAVLKTATGGYDGKGQAVIREYGQADAAYAALATSGRELILERFVPFVQEISVVGARDQSGQVTLFPVTENRHQAGILVRSQVPARIPAPVAAEARRIAGRLLEELSVIGLLAVEMFVTADGQVLVNEMAPRPHNTAHVTWEATETSQFEQLLRILCGLPLGSPRLRQPAVMFNLLGHLWPNDGSTPDFREVLAVPGARLHLYGKEEARPGRKMGHVTVLGADEEETEDRAAAVEEALDRMAALGAGGRDGDLPV